MKRRVNIVLPAAILYASFAWCMMLASAQAPSPTPVFLEVAAQAGLGFTHISGASGQYYIPEQMGAGVALFDYDGDADLDVFLVQSGTLGKRDPAVTGRLYRNDLSPTAGSSLRFTDVTLKSGIDASGYGMGAATGDYDNDGDLDLLVTSFGPEALYRNNGNGTFTNVTQASGLGDELWSSSAAFVDYDRDGDLDIFVANYLDFTVAGNKRCNDAVGARDYCSPRAYKPVPDRLYRNDGRGRFTDVSDAAGITKADGAGLGVSVGDYNGDGWLDLYVANDATPNQLWINQKNGTFVDDGLLSGTALNAAGNPEGSMGIASGDYDADGDEDLFVTNIVGETFVLYGNDGRASFDDIRARVGLAAPTAAFTGFGAGLDRLRQRRLARSPGRERRGQRHRSAARREIPVSHAQPALSQYREGAIRGREQGRWSRVRARGNRPWRSLWRHRQ